MESKNPFEHLTVTAHSLVACSTKESCRNDLDEVDSIRATVIQEPGIEKETGKGDSVDDFGLRRRFISQYNDSVHFQRTTEFTKENPKVATDSDGKSMMRFGSTSRKILYSNSDHDQPPKMKRRKKNSPRGKSTMKKIKSLGTKTVKKSRSDFKFHAKTWATGDDFLSPQVDSYAIFVLRDFVAYLIFMVIVCFAVFGSYGSAYNYFSDVMSKLVTESSFITTQGFKITFNEMRNRHDVWEFIPDVLLEIVYEKNHSALAKKVGHVIRESMFFGAPQIRQVRVKGNTCESAPMFGDMFHDCADYYSDDIEDKESFGLNTSVWRYAPPLASSTHYTGKISTYGGGGYAINFTRDENFTRSWIDELRKEQWIRFGTRAVFIDFTVFNPNTLLICVVKLIIEMPPFGGVIPSAKFYTMKISRYFESWDFFILSCAIVFICFVVYYTFEETTQIIRLGETYLANKWNILDIVILLCSYSCIVLGFVCHYFKHYFVRETGQYLRTSFHVSFDAVVNVQSRFDTSSAVLVFVVWLKILKFSKLNRTISLILAGFARVSSLLIVATIMMMVYVVAFSLFGFVKFGSVHREFKSVGSSITTMIRMVQGGLHFYHSPAHHGHFDGWLMAFIMLFILSVKAVFINIFIGLIIHGFQTEVNEVNDISSPATVNDVFREAFCRFLTFTRQNKIVERIQDNEETKQNMRIYDALVAILRRHGFESVEIALILAKSNIVFGDTVSKEKMSQVYDDIFVRNQLFLEVNEHSRAREQLETVVKGIDLYEQTILSIQTKVDILTNYSLVQRS